jgi:hypothetical protein
MAHHSGTGPIHPLPSICEACQQRAERFDDEHSFADGEWIYCKHNRVLIVFEAHGRFRTLHHVDPQDMPTEWPLAATN